MKTLDAGQAETNKLIEKVEKRVNKEYSQATKDMQKKLNNYLKSFESKDKAMQKQLADGLITEKQYKDWRYGQIMVGKRWQEQLDVLSKDLENSRQIAMNIVSGELPSAYAIGHNYGTYLVESGTSLNTSYTLYDRDTVSKLLKDRPKLLPDPTKGSKTEQALKSKQIQKWSKAKMTSAVAQGVLQGEAIPKIASRLRNVTDMSYRASIRNARTMLTSSENLGRQASFERAKSMGIEMEKQWLATLDDRTRDSHALMDGERVPLDKNFSNGLEYPADPSGEPEEIYNCRCTMVTAIKGFEKAITDFDLSENEKLHGMTYDEWKESHLHNDTGNGIIDIAGEVVDTMSDVVPFEWADEYRDVFKDNNDEFVEALYDNNAALTYNKYSDRIEGGFLQKAGNGYYQPSSDTVVWDYRKSSPFAPALGDGYNKFGTFCHEFGHAVDYHIAEDVSLSYKEQGVLQNVGRRLTGWFDKKKGSNCDEFLSAFRKDKDALSTVMKSENAGDVIQDIRKHTSTGLQDAFDGMFGTRSVSVSSDTFLPWGHGERYYNRNYNAFKDLDKYYPNVYRDKKPWRIAKDELESIGLDVKKQADVKAIFRDHETASELWANLHMAISVGGEQLEMFEKYMPNSLAEFRRIIGQLN